jgi:hypothetical protein
MSLKKEEIVKNIKMQVRLIIKNIVVDKFIGLYLIEKRGYCKNLMFNDEII